MLHLNFKKKLTNFGLHVEVEIPDGLVVLFGPSGAGKTTTLRAIAGLVAPEAGEMRYDGQVLFSSEKKINLPPQRRRIGCVFQESRLFPHLSVEENLHFGMHGLSSRQRTFAIDEIVEVLQLENLLARQPLTCSAGEQQRVALGRALLASPRYLLMDEPLAAVDVPERWRILTALREMHCRHHLPVLYVSHDPGTVLNFAEHMILLRPASGTRHSSVEASGSPLQLLQRYSEDHRIPVVENILAAIVAQHGRGYTEVRAGELHLQSPLLKDASGALLAAGTRIFLQIPAPEILLATDQPSGLSARNVFSGNIADIRAMQDLMLVEVDIGEKIVAEVLPITIDALDLKVGGRVFVIIKASGIRRV